MVRVLLFHLCTRRRQRLVSSLFYILVVTIATSCSSGDSGTTIDLESGSPTLSLNEPSTFLLEDELLGNEQQSTEFVDCKLTLPCQWSSTDVGLDISVESIIGDLFSDSLATTYEIQSFRDTSVGLLGTAALIDSDGRRYTANPAELINESAGFDVGNTVRVLAGIGVGVNQSFRGVPEFTTRSVARYTMEIAEVGFVHRVGFLNLPLDSASGQGVNCRLQLPCTWHHPDDEYSVTVLLADSVQDSRLAVYFSVDVFANSVLTLAQGSVAKGNDGTIFDPKIQTLGDQSDYLKIELPAVSGATVMGSQTYFRTAAHLSTSLKQLELRIDQENTAEVTYPVFNDIPLN